MIKFHVIFQTSRKFVIELGNQGKFTTKTPYIVWVNGKYWMNSNRVVETIDGLEPDTEYEIIIRNKEGDSEPKRLRTDFEYVTLNAVSYTHLPKIWLPPPASVIKYSSPSRSAKQVL